MPSLTPRRTRFRYDAIAHDGTTVHGTITAASRARARQRLSVHHLIPTALHDAPGLLHTEVTPDRLGRHDLEQFVAHLAVFTASGVPLPTALQVIADETEHRVLRRTATDLAQRLTDGETLGDAVEAHAQVLPTHVRGVLRSAEVTGDLTRVLTGLHHHLERQAASRRRLVTALVYPGVVAAMSLVTMGVLAGFALPRFSALFRELGADPPWAAHMASALGGAVRTWWPAILMVLVGLGAGLTWGMRSPRLHASRHRLLWHAPVIRHVVRLAQVERTCRVLALATTSGVALPAALDVAADVSHHPVVATHLSATRDHIVSGEGVVEAFDRTGLLPPAARHIVAVGERTGTLDRQFGVAADLLASELDRRLQRLTAVVEPALIVIVGVVVAGVAISLVTSLYGVVHQLGR